MCPFCGGIQIRRSHRRGLEYVHSWLKRGYYPYRCRSCQTRFWALRRAVDEAVAQPHPESETPVPAQINPPPLTVEVSHDSSKRSRSRRSLRRWFWRKTNMELEIFILLAILGAGALVVVWWMLGKFT